MLGDTLRQHRNARGLTQSELARLARIERSNLAHLERGTYCASAAVLGRLARALDLSTVERAELLDLAAGAGVAVDEVVGG